MTLVEVTREVRATGRMSDETYKWLIGEFEVRNAKWGEKERERRFLALTQECVIREAIAGCTHLPAWSNDMAENIQRMKMAIGGEE